MVEIKRNRELKKTFENQEKTKGDFKKFVLDRYARIKLEIGETVEDESEQKEDD